MSIFDKNREIKKKTVLEKLKAFFNRFFDIAEKDSLTDWNNSSDRNQ